MNKIVLVLAGVTLLYSVHCNSYEEPIFLPDNSPSYESKEYILVDGETSSEDESAILQEQEGISFIEVFLSTNGYEVEVNDGSWYVSFAHPDTEEYIELSPDIRFRKDETKPFSFIEYSTPEDAGLGIQKDFPFYRKIEMGSKDAILTALEDILAGM